MSADEIGVGVTDPDELIHAKATSSAVYFKSESGSTVGVFGASNTAGAAVSGSTTASDYQLWSANQLRWTISGSTGNLVANSTGIDFGSGASTTLSDYEIGGYDATLTPATSGTITVYTASDRLQYTRVGDLVSITGKITTTAVSSPVGDYVQLNVPFAIGNLTDSAGHFSGSCVIFNATGTMGNYSIIGIEGDSFVRIYKNTSNAASATAPDFSGNESVYVGFSYHTDA